LKIIKRKDRKPQKNKGNTNYIKVSSARIAAFEILDKIKRMRSYSSILLPNYEKDLSPKDRGLCHEIVLGVLRKKIFLDAVIKKFTKDKILDDEIITALRIGIYQMLFLDKVPEYSAINESVNLAKRAGKKSASGLVNAVLRSVQRHGEFDFKFKDEVEKIVFETSHPRLLIEKWIGEFGIEEAEKIAAANNEISRPTFRLTEKFYRRDVATQKEILESLDDSISTSENVKDAFVAEKFGEELLKLAEVGEIYFQEEASQMVADAVEVKAGEKFLDLCAAPGSKTSFISQKSEVRSQKSEEKSLIIAGDYYTHRIENLKNNLENQAAEFIDIVQYDAMLDLPFADESFDVILIDAPCSGTGTIRHNPEIRYFLREEDFEMLSDKQLTILENASKILKTGGKLIYSTCSLEIEENEAVIEKFLNGNSNFKKIAPNVAEKFLTEDGFGRTFPHRDLTDGFFIATLERTA
jgi:16S rRNA (cytosine967-C5)-methyltransferase